jgi:hypothetical protein
MKLISLNINSGLFSDFFSFSDGINLIHSKVNSVGKTTLLRFILFSLGYPIPDMKGINFDNFDLDLEIIDESNNKCHVQRRKDFISYITNEEASNFSLPSDLNKLHKLLFNIENNEVLENLLGSFYMDQEKGWTLLNRGIVIGKIRFNIEGLVRGLSDRSDKILLDKLASLKREMQKYKYMFDMAKYQKEVKKLGEDIAYDSPEEKIDTQIRILLNERLPIQDELDRIRNVIKDNKKFIDFISSYNIVVINSEGTEIRVNASTIKGFDDNVNYLITKRRFCEKDIFEIDRKINNLRKQQQKNDVLINLQTNTQVFDGRVLNIPIDQIVIDKAIKKIAEEIRFLETKITNKIKIKNPVVFELHESIKNYALKLNINEKYIRPYEDFIFTDDLKTLSGAILHKIVFCFKMSYIKTVRKYTGAILPIILDSPSGREIDEININEMMKILNADFTDHQIIIASIHTYRLDNIKKIEIVDHLLHLKSEVIQNDTK